MGLKGMLANRDIADSPINTFGEKFRKAKIKSSAKKEKKGLRIRVELHLPEARVQGTYLNAVYFL